MNEGAFGNIIFGSRSCKTLGLTDEMKNNSLYRLMRITMSRAPCEKCVVTIDTVFLCVAIDCNFAGGYTIISSPINVRATRSAIMRSFVSRQTIPVFIIRLRGKNCGFHA